MSSSPSSNSSQGLGSYLWNSLPRRAMQSGIFSGALAAGETLLICTYTPSIAIDAVQYLATGILISSALIVCHSLGDRNTSYKNALKEPLIKGRVIWLKAQGFLNGKSPPLASSSSSSESSEQISLNKLPKEKEQEFLNEETPPLASSSSSSESSEQISLNKLPKEVAKIVVQTIRGSTRVFEFCGAQEEAVLAGLALGGTTYLLLEDGQTSAFVAGGSAAVAGTIFFPIPLEVGNAEEKKEE